MAVFLDNRKVLIYDRTIIQNSDSLARQYSVEVVKFIKVLKNLGVDLIEIDDNILRNFKSLPDDVDYVFRFDKDINEYQINRAKYIVIEYSKALRLESRIHKMLRMNEIILEISVGDIDKIFLDENKAIFSMYNIKYINITDIKKYNVFKWDKLIKTLKAQFMVGVGFCADNEMNMATAVSTEACLDGVDFVTTMFNGSENACASLEEVLLALKVIGGGNVIGNLKLINATSEIYTKLTNKNICSMKAILGADIFKYESGIHVDGIEKDSKTYEPFEPIEIGQIRKMYIGKHSGKKALMVKLNELNLNYTKIDLDNLLCKVREKSVDCRRNVLDEELIEMYKNLKFVS